MSRELAELEQADSRVVVGGHVADRRAFALLLRESLGYIHGHSVGGINPVLIEAMGCGARIVALDTLFNREALGDCGDYFSDPATDLPTVLDRLLSEPSRENDARRRDAGERARTRFSCEAVADAYEQLLASAARRQLPSGRSLPTPWEEPG